jgi:drug/metabolite transporter (DMT)-like permease
MSRRAWAAFAAVSLLWGMPFLFIKVADRGGFTPGLLACSRGALAAVVLLALAWRAGTLSTLRGYGRWLWALAITELVIPFLAIAIGEEHVSSSLSAIVIASVPLMVALLALRFDHSERPTPLGALGLLVGFGGVVALLGVDVAGHTAELLSAAALLLGAFSYAVGAMIVKHRMSEPDPVATIGACLAISALVSVPYAIVDWPSKAPSAGALGALVVLAFGCGAFALVVWLGLIREVGPSRGSVTNYINPLVAVVLGVTLLGERLGSGAVAGLILILVGSWLATDARLPRLGDRHQQERVDHEERGERDRSAIEVALDQ